MAFTLLIVGIGILAYEVCADESGGDRSPSPPNMMEALI